MLSLRRPISHEKLRERPRKRLKNASTETKIHKNVRRQITPKEIKKEFFRLSVSLILSCPDNSGHEQDFIELLSRHSKVK